jgi:hypothetical protein
MLFEHLRGKEVQLIPAQVDISEEIKHAVEAAGLTGTRFIEV